MRSHPIRFMMANGLQISLNSGHPGILGHHDVSLDYLAVFVAWDFGLKDLKQISLNGLNHSSLDQDAIKSLRNLVFEDKWRQFIEFVLENYEENFM